MPRVCGCCGSGFCAYYLPHRRCVTSLFLFLVFISFSYVLLFIKTVRQEPIRIGRLGEEPARRSLDAPRAPKRRHFRNGRPAGILPGAGIGLGRKLESPALKSPLSGPTEVLIVTAHLAHLAEVAFADDQFVRVRILHYLAPV